MILPEQKKKQIRERLAGMVEPVKVVNFTQELECQFCRETRQLMHEVSGLSDKLSLEVYNFVTDKAKAEAHRVDKIPATLLLGRKDYGVRIFGIPGGYEFATLLEGIVAVSRGDSGLSAASREKLATLARPVHLQVFVTPT